MIQKTAIIKSKFGLHARPSALVATASRKYPDTKIWLINQASDKKVEADSILGLMMMELPCDAEVLVQAKGDKAEEAVDAIVKILESFEADI
jgi:phosphocarrier protein HPr